MNLLERMLGAIAPGYALSRAQKRVALRIFQEHEQRLAYDAAGVGRRAAKWNAPSSSSNAEIAGAHVRVRNRSRDMVRNNPYARSAISKLVARTVGTGIMASWPKIMQPVWQEFCDVCDWEGQLDFYGLEAMIARTVIESGACVIRKMYARDSERVPLRIHVLEPDYLDELKFGPHGENFVLFGIEVDRFGRRVAYWIYPHHPGEVAQFPGKSWRSDRVPASEVLHVYEKERPGQLTGMPRLATSMMRLKDVDDYQDAQMMRKKIEACFAMFVESAGSSVPIAGAGQVSTDAEGRRIEGLSPGMVMYGKPGEKVTFGNPAGTMSSDDYTNDQLHAIAAGVGVTYEQLTGDFSQVTYLSARGALVEFRELVDQFRWITLIPMGLERIARWLEEAAYTAGRARTSQYVREWTTPPWPFVDPGKDVKAAKEEVLAGFASRTEKQRERGRDPLVLQEEIKKEREQAKKDGTVYDTDAGAAPKLAAPAAEPKPADADDDDAKPGSKKKPGDDE